LDGLSFEISANLLVLIVIVGGISVHSRKADVVIHSCNHYVDEICCWWGDGDDGLVD
jgi:hypothetical protein